MTSWGVAGRGGGLAFPSASPGLDVCGMGAVRPAPVSTTCTKQVDASGLPGAVGSASPGDRICVRGKSADRLTVSRSGAPGNPIMIIGDGRTAVKGITVTGSHVVVQGFDVVGAKAPGIQLTGNNITVLNNTVRSPRGGDGDGIRFFGNNLQILHNTISDVRNLNKAHADCMQTFATDSDSPASKQVHIDSNRCEKIDNQCLIAEGPNSSAGDGSGKGVSSNITFTHNFCDTKASQAVMVDDVQNMVITANNVTGKNQKAFALDNKSTGARISGNTVAQDIGYEVGMDSTSRKGYQGPKVGGEPFLGRSPVMAGRS
ncbi:MAG TPA: right-handed parallel beta-helix repeat-containing protein [Pseudonocardia sp.]